MSVVSPRARSWYLSFDVEAWIERSERLEASGVRFAQRPTEAPWGGRAATFFDPAGHTVWVVRRAMSFQHELCGTFETAEIGCRRSLR
jgi:uncharacterized glyoxalase superfamily protein PhnB